MNNIKTMFAPTNRNHGKYTEQLTAGVQVSISER